LGKVENLKELVRAGESFESLSAFLEHVSLVLDRDEQNPSDQVSIMTLHSAKGLEFDHVFLPGWEEGLFPHQRSLEERSGLEEERRLAYVGMTRARKTCSILFAANRKLYHNWQASLPSRFLQELPNAHVKRNLEPNYQKHNIAPTPPISKTFSYRQEPHPNMLTGKKIFHEQFGSGTLLRQEGNRLEIKFDTGEIRNIIHSFVRILP
jgi:DNA helicase-2/ATP-dependent DNA helicase PcrA